jgi:GNAT superfamily N-acetyltransferase
MEGMTLNLKDADLSRFAMLLDGLKGQGVALVSLAEEQEQDSDWALRLYELHKMALQDWPNDDPTRPIVCIPPDAFADSIKDQVAQSEGVFIAKINGAYAGYCGALGTAVHPRFRRWGIATALKLRYIDFAKKDGMESLFTSSANPAIIAMNKKIGYQAGSTEVRFIKRLINGL